MSEMNYHTLKVRFESDFCYIQIYRPQANNTINDLLIEEFQQVIALCHGRSTVVILEGLPEVFCFGADFEALSAEDSEKLLIGPELLYNLWMELVTGPFITVAHVRGKVNAGGIGFVAACNFAIADNHAQFSLSELLFGLMPACVLPFLIRRIGFQKANAMTLLTKPVHIEQAHSWGLIDAYAENSEVLLHRYLLRLRRLNKKTICRYKRYMNSLDNSLEISKQKALLANREVFMDSENRNKIARYVNTGKFPWDE